MTAPQFTLGSCVLWPNGVPGRVAAVDGDLLMDECGGWHDAFDVDPDDEAPAETPNDTKQATASLIAAAPELYERLTNALHQLQHLRAFPENTEDASTISLIELIEADLAKARGETPNDGSIPSGGSGL